MAVGARSCQDKTAVVNLFDRYLDNKSSDSAFNNGSTTHQLFIYPTPVGRIRQALRSIDPMPVHSRPIRVFQRGTQHLEAAAQTPTNRGIGSGNNNESLASARVTGLKCINATSRRLVCDGSSGCWAVPTSADSRALVPIEALNTFLRDGSARLTRSSMGHSTCRFNCSRITRAAATCLEPLPPPRGP